MKVMVKRFGEEVRVSFDGGFDWTNSCLDPRSKIFSGCEHDPVGPAFWRWAYKNHEDLLVAIKSGLVREVELDWPE